MPTQEQIHDWKYEVANDDTRRGLEDWVAAQIEAGAYTTDLEQFVLDVRFIDGDKNCYFACHAEDEQHALEQAANAYPDYNEMFVSHERGV